MNHRNRMHPHQMLAALGVFVAWLLAFGIVLSMTAPVCDGPQDTRLCYFVLPEGQ